MTPLEEKIETFIKKWKKDNSYDTCDTCDDETCGCHQENIDFKIDIQSIATQAVEEYKKELLEKLPKRQPEFYPEDPDVNTGIERGFNFCLDQVRNIISKPNI